MKRAIQIDKKDNVATVTGDVDEGEKLEVLSPEGGVLLVTQPREAVIFGHKIALKQFDPGDEIIKYGEVIGVASRKIDRCEWVHTHNVASGRLPTGKLEELK